MPCFSALVKHKFYQLQYICVSWMNRGFISNMWAVYNTFRVRLGSIPADIGWGWQSPPAQLTSQSQDWQTSTHTHIRIYWQCRVCESIWREPTHFKHMNKQTPSRKVPGLEIYNLKHQFEAKHVTWSQLSNMLGDSGGQVLWCSTLSLSLLVK